MRRYGWSPQTVETDHPENGQVAHIAGYALADSDRTIVQWPVLVRSGRAGRGFDMRYALRRCAKNHKVADRPHFPAGR